MPKKKTSDEDLLNIGMKLKDGETARVRDGYGVISYPSHTVTRQGNKVRIYDGAGFGFAKKTVRISGGSSGGGGSGGGSGSSGGGGGCFVATAVYGDPNCYEVNMLRGFRDNVLQESLVGRLFTKLYYSGIGERIAQFIETKIPSTIPYFRKGLDHLVEKYSRKIA